MTDQQQMTLDDCTRATAALAHWLAGDLPALQAILGSIEGDADRLTATYLATLQLVRSMVPDRRSTIAYLQTVAARVAAASDVEGFPYTGG